MRAWLLWFTFGCRADMVYDAQTHEVEGCDALAAALDDAHRLRFGPAGKLTLRLRGSGSSDCTRPLVIAHPQGDHLYIEGPSDDPGANVLYVRHGGHGLEIVGGGLGGLSGLTLENDRASSGAVGLLARNGAEVTLGGSFILRNFAVGVQAAYGSTVRNTHEADQRSSWLISGSSRFGVLATGASEVTLTDGCVAMEPMGDCSAPHADCPGRDQPTASKASGVSIDEASYGNLSRTIVRCARGAGMSALRNSFLTAEDALITSSQENGVVSHSGAHVRAGRTTSEKNGLAGFSVNNGATLHAREGRAVDNGGYGFVGANMATIDARQAEVLHNGDSAFRGFLRTNIYAEDVVWSDNGHALPGQRRVDVLVSRGSSAWLRDGGEVPLRLTQCPMVRTTWEQSFVYWVGPYVVVSPREPTDARGRPCVGPGTQGVAWVRSE